MVINSFKWRPTLESIIKFNGKYYYATLRGINIIELDSDGFKVLFSEAGEDVWGAFHFSILYGDNIVFCPHIVDYLYIYDLCDMKGKKIEIPERKKNEHLMPFISDGQLYLFANMTSRIYKISKEWEISEGFPTDNRLWKLFRQRDNLQCICMWSDESNSVKYLLKDERKIREINTSGTKIYNAVSDDINIYIDTTDGKLLIYDLKKAAVKKVIPITGRIDNSKIFLLNDSLFIMPGIGNQVMEISLLEDLIIKNHVIDFNLNNKNTSWTILDDERVIGIAQDKEYPWKENLLFFEYNPICNKCVEIPIDTIIKNDLIRNCKSEGVIVQEDSRYGLTQFLQLVTK